MDAAPSGLFFRMTKQKRGTVGCLFQRVEKLDTLKKGEQSRTAIA